MRSVNFNIYALVYESLIFLKSLVSQERLLDTLTEFRYIMKLFWASLRDLVLFFLLRIKYLPYLIHSFIHSFIAFFSKPREEHG
jgi:hypothetical protein